MNILQEIIDFKKIEVEDQKAASGLTEEDLREQCANASPVVSFIKKLEEKKESGHFALIAEVKKASPSKGVIREDFNPAEIAIAYKNAGADAISVLTDVRYFDGSFKNLRIVKQNVDLPVLRKDFIIDPYQVYQTRLMEADIILLIAAALTADKLKELYQLAKSIGLDVLVEVHNKQEMQTALEIGAKLIGINNRNLETFEVSIDTTLRLIKDLDLNDRFIISESGIKDSSDLLMLKQNGVSGVLVGESLIRQSDIEKATRELLKDCR